MRCLPGNYNALLQIITVEGGTIAVKDVVMFGNALLSSSGYVLIDKDKKVYIPNYAPDILSTLSNLAATLTALQTLLSGSGLGSITVDSLTNVCYANVGMPGVIAATEIEVARLLAQVNDLMRSLI